MDKKDLLKRLETLFGMPEVTKGFKSQSDCVSWANKVAPLLKLVDVQYYVNFIENSHKLNLNLSYYTIVPAFNIMKSQVEMAIEDLRLQIEIDEGLRKQMYFPEGSYLDIQVAIAKVIRQATRILWVYDGYMDEKIVEELREIPALEIKLLTEQPKGLFVQRLEALKSNTPTRVSRQGAMEHLTTDSTSLTAPMFGLWVPL